MLCPSGELSPESTSSCIYRRGPIRGPERPPFPSGTWEGVTIARIDIALPASTHERHIDLRNSGCCNTLVPPTSESFAVRLNASSK